MAAAAACLSVGALSAHADNPLNNIDHIIVIYQENWSFDALYGSFPGANGIANASAVSLQQLDRLTGAPLNTEIGANNYNNPSKPATLLQNTPPQPLNGTVDPNFPNTLPYLGVGALNTLVPYSLANYITPGTLTGDIVHRYWTEMLQIDGGANNKFITWSDNPGLVMSHFDATTLPEGMIAAQYTLCDNYFHSAFGGSFLNHQFFIAAAPPIYPNANVVDANNIYTLNPDGSLALNTSGKLVLDGNITPIGGQVYNFPPGTTFDKNYAVNTIFSANLQSHGGSLTAANLLPTQNNLNPADPTYHQNIGDILDSGGVSWKWYSGGWNDALNSSPNNPITHGVPNTVDPNFQWHHQAFAFFEKSKPFDASYADGRNPYATAHLQDENNFFTDVSAGTLPSVCFIKPVGENNEHPGYASVIQGMQHVASIVAAVQANPSLWAHTAIIITYDEHGGRWDHVTPPTRDIWGPGLRVPAVVVSPFALQGYVDHTQRDTSSILATIEQRYGLPSLNQRDANAPTFANVLTDTQFTLGASTVNRRTGQISQPVTIVNNGSDTISGPINFVLNNLSANTSPANSAGVTVNTDPGSPYITVSTAGLAPGASASATLLFAKPSSGSVSYNGVIVSGTAAP